MSGQSGLFDQCDKTTDTSVRHKRTRSRHKAYECHVCNKKYYDSGKLASCQAQTKTF